MIKVAKRVPVGARYLGAKATVEQDLFWGFNSQKVKDSNEMFYLIDTVLKVHLINSKKSFSHFTIEVH